MFPPAGVVFRAKVGPRRGFRANFSLKFLPLALTVQWIMSLGALIVGFIVNTAMGSPSMCLIATAAGSLDHRLFFWTFLGFFFDFFALFQPLQPTPLPNWSSPASDWPSPSSSGPPPTFSPDGLPADLDFSDFGKSCPSIVRSTWLGWSLLSSGGCILWVGHGLSMSKPKYSFICTRGA